MLDVDQIYVCHWSKLRERKARLIEHLSKVGINDWRWVQCFDKEKWDLDQIKADYPTAFDRTTSNTFLNYSEISLVLKHCWAIKDAYEQGYESFLMLEDDVQLHPDFVNLFNNFKAQLPEDWDLAWVGSCCGLHARTVPNQNVYRVDGSRCTHAFIVSKGCINKIVDTIYNVNDAADHYFNYLIKEFQLNNYWFEPSLADQNETYNTSVHYKSEIDRKQ